MRNPCLTNGPDGSLCDLAGFDKNNDTCKNCSKRLEYINFLGLCPCSYNDMPTDGHGGFDWDNLKTHYFVDVNDKENIQKFIKSMCDKFYTTVESLQNERHQTQPVPTVREKIARILFEKGLERSKIGPLIGSSYNSVCRYVKGVKK